jgi:hypothetical protein
MVGAGHWDLVRSCRHGGRVGAVAWVMSDEQALRRLILGVLAFIVLVWWFGVAVAAVAAIAAAFGTVTWMAVDVIRQTRR